MNAFPCILYMYTADNYHIYTHRHLNLQNLNDCSGKNEKLDMNDKHTIYDFWRIFIILVFIISYQQNVRLFNVTHCNSSFLSFEHIMSTYYLWHYGQIRFFFLTFSHIPIRTNVL